MSFLEHRQAETEPLEDKTLLQELLRRAFRHGKEERLLFSREAEDRNRSDHVDQRVVTDMSAVRLQLHARSTIVE